MVSHAVKPNFLFHPDCSIFHKRLGAGSLRAFRKSYINKTGNMLVNAKPRNFLLLHHAPHSPVRQIAPSPEACAASKIFCMQRRPRRYFPLQVPCFHWAYLHLLRSAQAHAEARPGFYRSFPVADQGNGPFAKRPLRHPICCARSPSTLRNAMVATFMSDSVRGCQLQ